MKKAKIPAPFYPDHAIAFSEGHVENGQLKVTNTRMIRQSDIRGCPFFIMVASHYRDDGSCKCDDPIEQAMMIREWGYKRKNFRRAL